MKNATGVRSSFVVSVLVIPLAAFAAEGMACSSSSPSTGGGDSSDAGTAPACDAPISDASPPRMLSMPVTGGIMGTLVSDTGGGYEYTSATGTALRFRGGSTAGPTLVTLHVTGKLTGGETGPLPLESITIEAHGDAGDSAWQTPMERAPPWSPAARAPLPRFRNT